MAGARSGIWMVDLGGLALCAVVTAGAYLLGAGPVVAEVHERIESQRAARAMRAESDSLSADRRKLEREAAALRADVERSTLVLDPAAELNARLGRLAELARSVGVRVDELKPGEPAPAEQFERIPITVAASGRFPDCARFLRAIRGERGDIAVGKLEIVGGAAVEGDVRLIMELVWHAAPRKGSR